MFLFFLWLVQYNFEGRYDLVKFVKLVGSSGLYLHLRIGPYVCAEWNFGYFFSSHNHWCLFIFLIQLCLCFFFPSILVRGFPLWLRDVPGIKFRTDNEPFKVHSDLNDHFTLSFIVVLLNVLF